MPQEGLLMLRSALFWSGFCLFLFLEILFPYRPASAPKFRRLVTNMSLAIGNGLVLNIALWSVMLSVTSLVSERNAGLLNVSGLSAGMKIFLTVVFMDFAIYVWHLLNHEAPLLWRFHRVHHSDLNMDVSTASRFHPGELAGGGMVKLGVIYFIGADMAGIVIFESLLVLSAQFHHSCLRVPGRFERFFWILFVPPSMHRIHHSVVIRQRNTNYGTILSLWDRALGTLLTKVEQGGIHIGIGAYRRSEGLTLGRLLAMPFSRVVR